MGFLLRGFHGECSPKEGKERMSFWAVRSFLCFVLGCLWCLTECRRMLHMLVGACCRYFPINWKVDRILSVLDR